MAPQPQPTVTVVGAGPVGILTALHLARAKIPTLVLEAHPSMLRTTRAVVYMPMILNVLSSLGVLEKIKEQGWLNNEGIVWRDIDHKILAHMPVGSGHGKEGKDFDGILQIGQARFNDLVLEELEKEETCEVRFGCRVVGIEDTGQKARIKIHHEGIKEGDSFVESNYVLATDGANSRTRQLMNIPFEGFSYAQFKMMGIDLFYDFAAHQNLTRLNFIVHPKDCAVIAYTGEDEGGGKPGSGIPLWRVAYVEDPNLPEDKASREQRAIEQVMKYTRGDGNFKLTRAEPYVLHQRCAAQARKGRVMFAGDALHSNNPIGGLGLTGGILDAHCYGNAFTRVIKGNEPDSLLTECANSRRDTWLSVTNPTSKKNLDRLYLDGEEDRKEREHFFDQVNTSKEFQKKFIENLRKMIPETFAVAA